MRHLREASSMALDRVLARGITPKEMADRARTATKRYKAGKRSILDLD